MKKKNGFISISIVYTFFIVFLLLLVLVITSYVNRRITLNIYKQDIKEYFLSEKLDCSNLNASNCIIKLYNNGEYSIQTDTHGSYINYRYTGANPDNYACLTSDCTQLFRIIGVFNKDSHGNDSQLVKLITADSIGVLPFDYKQKYVGSSLSNYGSNDWSDSQLMFMLNGYMKYNDDGTTNGKNTYSGYNIITNSSSSVDNKYTIEDKKNNSQAKTSEAIYTFKTSYLLGDGTKTLVKPSAAFATNYYNTLSGTEKTTFLSDAKNASGGETVGYPITSITALKSSQKSLVQEVTWHLGGYSSAEITMDQAYIKEKENETYCSKYTCTNVTRPSTWIGKIGILQVSDYAYATSNRTSTCNDSYTYLNAWPSDCYKNDWLLYPGSRTGSKASAVGQWTMMPDSKYYSFEFMIGSGGQLSYYYACCEYTKSGPDTSTGYNVRPSFYIKSTTKIVSGTGTSSDPYIITN